jgi:Na+/melibiose symporter-like transporter
MEHADDNGDRTRPTSAWRVPNFRRLWFGSTVSWFGSEIGELALPLLAIITLSASAAEVGILRAAQFLPFLLATLPFGVLVDRRKRLPLMIGADVGRFVLIGTVPVLVWIGAAHMEVLYVIVFAAGTLTVLYQLADFAFLPRVVATTELLDANGKLSASQSAAEISGKGVGGLFVQAVSAPFAVVLDAMSYLLSAISLRRITVDESSSTPASGKTAARHDIAEGLRVVFRNRYVRPLLGEATTFNFFNEVFILGLLLYTVRDLDVSPALLGLIFTAGGVGTFLGAWYGARVTGLLGYGRALLATMLLGNTAPVGVLLVSGPGAGTLPIFCTVFFLIGLGSGLANVHAVSLRQTAIPGELQGRVNAAYRLFSWGAVPVGAGLGGLLAVWIGGHGAMLVGAFGLPLATLWVAISSVPRLTTINDAAAPHPAGDRR